ncbi:hypothetical protein PVK06_046781 [Gossypium arboreum]|uniref:Uncharacterized protein n=1 Tax=Gossypium arboreum TaxID=29729 RepID=A0ABR0ME63_GOSAR|nr:hypothetical protein PVK06_046781 [Gossypium arboreum]
MKALIDSPICLSCGEDTKSSIGAMRDYRDWSSVITVEERTRFFNQPIPHCFVSNSLIDVKDITLMTFLTVRYIWKSENNFNSGHRGAQEIMNFSLSRARCYTVGEVRGNGGPSFSKEECWEPPSVGWIGEGCQKKCKDDGKWILGDANIYHLR